MLRAELSDSVAPSGIQGAAFGVGRIGDAPRRVCGGTRKDPFRFVSHSLCPEGPSGEPGSPGMALFRLPCDGAASPDPGSTGGYPHSVAQGPDRSIRETSAPVRDASGKLLLETLPYSAEFFRYCACEDNCPPHWRAWAERLPDYWLWECGDVFLVSADAITLLLQSSSQASRLAPTQPTKGRIVKGYSYRHVADEARLLRGSYREAGATLRKKRENLDLVRGPSPFPPKGSLHFCALVEYQTAQQDCQDFARLNVNLPACSQNHRSTLDRMFRSLPR